MDVPWVSVHFIFTTIFLTARRHVPHLLLMMALKVQPRPHILVTYSAGRRGTRPHSQVAPWLFLTHHRGRGGTGRGGGTLSHPSVPYL